MVQEKGSSIGFAMFSGFCIFFGNLAEQYALALAGVTIAVPMFSSCIVVLGEPPDFGLPSPVLCTGERRINTAAVTFVLLLEGVRTFHEECLGSRPS